MLSKAWAVIPLLVLFSFGLVYGQHHGGEAAPPVSFGNKKVTVETSIQPVDFIPEKQSTTNLKVRFFDSLTNTNIEKVTYRVQIYSGDKLLMSQMFYDKDGELDVTIRPNSECAEKELWRCTKYEGDKDLVVPGALTSSAISKPVVIGPVFDKSGTYKVKVAIIGATNPKTQTTEDINFETNISIAHEQKFSIKTAQGQTPILVKTYQDRLSKFQFDEQTRSITFEMPFNWDHAEHVSLVRNDIDIPKGFEPFTNVNSFKGTVNGIPIFAKDLHFDPYSNKDTDIIHFLVTGEELKLIKQKVGPDQHTMFVEISPDASNAIKSKDVIFSNGYKAIVNYDTRYNPSKDVSFTITFFDSSGSLAKEIRYAYSVKDSKGDEFVINTGNNAKLLGIAVPSGVDSRLITIPSEGRYTLQMVLVGSGLVDFDSFVPATMEFDVSETVPVSDGILAPPQKAAIPTWIRSNAKWWSEGIIGDSDFIQGIQFLINQKVIIIPSTTADSVSGSSTIPDWVKRNAGWWADGIIGDSDFVSGIQFLIKQGILRV